jgi:hypothetical protein
MACLQESINEGQKEQALPTTKPENQVLQHEIIIEGQTNVQIEEALTINKDPNAELTKVSFRFPMSLYSNSDGISHIISSRFSLSFKILYCGFQLWSEQESSEIAENSELENITGKEETYSKLANVSFLFLL